MVTDPLEPCDEWLVRVAATVLPLAARLLTSMAVPSTETEACKKL